jgi:hypothetical protein
MTAGSTVEGHGFLQAAEKLRFWVAQRFYRCDKAFLSLGALAPEVPKMSFSTACEAVP